ncbi:MAG TPA: hypothetical protein PK438_01650 [Clostridia bacterium]|nr:hypothetical protein [Clostridia bacterium]HOS17965.1 hypothetical protein [Clostridia bacterium]HPK14697.1 hypothetical protein [Clostridia bacterium]
MAFVLIALYRPEYTAFQAKRAIFEEAAEPLLRLLKNVHIAVEIHSVYNYHEEIRDWEDRHAA